MEVIIRPRGGGKTTRLLEWLRENPDRALLTFSEDRARSLRRANPDVGSRILSLLAAQRHGAIPSHVEIGIDDLDIILEMTFHARVACVSLTSPDEVQ